MEDAAGDNREESNGDSQISNYQSMDVDEQSSQLDDPSNENSMGALDNDMLCYCGKGRNLNAVEMQCSFCNRWFHSECIGCYIGSCIPFMTNYQFSCKQCSPNGLENFSRKQASFSQICYTVLANLQNQAKSKGINSLLFSKDKEIIPFIEKNWENLTTGPRRVRTNWHTTVTKTLSKDIELFSYSEEIVGDPCYGLSDTDLEKIGPSNEALKLNAGLPFGLKGGPVSEGRGRGTKRKAPFDSSTQPGTKAKRGDAMAVSKLSPHGYPLEHPFNKDGYRYILAESDPHAPNRQKFDESLDWAGKPIPGYLYRTFLGSDVLLALNDRAPQLKVSDDRLSVTGEKGYSLLRATHGINRDSWYYEVTVEEMPSDTAARIGWSQPLGNLQAPCGYDKFSYSWRSRKGTKFHQSRGKHYSDGGYKEGDVLGFYLHLPDPGDPAIVLPTTYKDRPLVKFKSHLYFEDKDHVAETEKNLKPAIGSQMIMFLNGQSQGVAFEDVFEGKYYPCISLYKNCRVSVNFGPDFKCPPQGLENFRPMSESASQTMVECSLADILYHIENEGKLPEF